MMRIVCFVIIASLLFIACSGQKPFIAEYEDSMTLQFVDTLSEYEKTAATSSLVDLDEMRRQMDTFCETGFDVPLYHTLDQLLADADKAVTLDSALLYRPLILHEFSAAISGSEFLFRFMCAMQRRLEDYFQHQHKKGEYAQSVPSDDGDYIYHFEQNVAELLPITQAQNKYSEVKTRLLSGLISFYSELSLAEDKVRFWAATERMLAELDLAPSQTGYEMFQRRADGLLQKPAVVLDQLLGLQTAETSPDVKVRAAMIIERAHQQLIKPLTQDDQQLIVTVDLNKKFMRQIFEDTSSRRSSREELLLWFERGYQSPDLRQKIEYYTRALHIDSLCAPAWNNRGNAFQACGDYDAALFDYHKALAIDPDFQLAYKNRGSLYLLKKEYEKALVDLEQAIERDAGCTVCYVDRGLLSMKLENYASALQDFSRAIELDGSHAPAWNYRGLCRQKLGHTEEALFDFAEAIALSPLYAAAYINRGNLHRQNHNDEKAIVDYTAVLAIDSTNFMAYNNRALSRKNIGEFTAAIADHQRALEINPDDPLTYYNLGCVYWELENWPAVVQSWEQCLAFDPDNEAAKAWLPLAEKQLRKQR